MSEEVNLDDCYKTALALAEKAGQMIAESVHNSKRIQTKSCTVDFVTETDKEVENFLRKSLQEKYPSHKFIGEESKEKGIPCDFTDAPTWIIDPVDGTMNFIHTYPFVAVSIGLAVNKEVVVGVIYNPLLKRLYEARKGNGAFCNGIRLQASGQTELDQSLLVSEMGSSRNPEKIELVFANMRHLINKVHSFRASGSGALNMCAIASGEADAYYEFGLHCWDIAAGTIIVQEAGGTVIDTEGGPIDIMARRVLCAGSSKLAYSLSKELKHMTLERD
ncbi:inositol monophosphatase 1-like [Centruroides sculpturatus]|uniref:inositol monophosphatase 1-like n=1 Tax=Centruroides sculpturatus TaxID=218467 RepID=UPI000C6C8C00|nr:inositol monophosphatase 1-like [Centruroides sculpturatus]